MRALSHLLARVSSLSTLSEHGSDSQVLSLPTTIVVVLLVLWFVATNLGWVKPLFLPTPQAVFKQFYLYLTG